MSSPDPSSQARVGTTLANKYRLKRVLGAGGMGAVYEAENLGTGRRVAVKVMLGQAATSTEMAARFLREARVASRVTHPNIVEVLDLDRDPVDQSPYIVQEFLVGRELADAIRERPGGFEPSEVLEIILPVMRALSAAHALNVVHRDLKPANIFLVEQAGGAIVPKIIDFGIAKLTGDDAAAESSDGLSLTRTGAAMGTPYYMSPEQARGVKDIDAQTDVWAIGVVLFEMLAGRRPFEADTYYALMFSLMEPPPRLDAVLPSASKDVADVIHCALTLDRTKRYATMQQFMDALLQAARVAGPVSAARAHTPVALQTPLASSGRAAISSADALNTTLGQSAGSVTVPTPDASRRAPMVLWVAGAVALAAATAVGFRLAGASHGSDVTPRPHVASAPPVTAAVAPPATYRVVLNASPPTAVLAFDGVDTGANALVRELPHDGRLHHVTATAPGYVSQTVEFQNAPPPERIELVQAPAPTPAPSIPVAALATPSRANAGHHPAGHATHATDGTGATAATAAPADTSHGSATIHPHGSQVQRDYP